MKRKKKRIVGRACAKFIRRGPRSKLRKALNRWMAAEKREFSIAKRIVCAAGGKAVSRKAKSKLAKLIRMWNSQESREHKVAKKLIQLAKKAIVSRRAKVGKRNAKAHNPFYDHDKVRYIKRPGTAHMGARRLVHVAPTKTRKKCDDCKVRVAKIKVKEKDGTKWLWCGQCSIGENPQHRKSARRRKK